MANVQFDSMPATRTPVTVADAAKIENLVTITDMPAGLLLDRIARPLSHAGDRQRAMISADWISR
jgi:hypothetical protein